MTAETFSSALSAWMSPVTVCSNQAIKQSSNQAIKQSSTLPVHLQRLNSAAWPAGSCHTSHLTCHMVYRSHTVSTQHWMIAAVHLKLCAAVRTCRAVKQL